MPSSISASDPDAPRVALDGTAADARAGVSRARVAMRWLLVWCVVVIAGAEGVARVGFDRISRIQRRTVSEYVAARAIGTTGADRDVLVVGNSLLDEGIDFARLSGALAPTWNARRFVVEQTFYYDWLFGLRRLMREGSRPDVVAVVLSPLQWIETQSRGDYSAHYLMSVADVPLAARHLQLTPNDTASLMLASISRFWGARAEIRNFLYGRAVPGLDRLMTMTAVVSQRTLTDDEVENVVASRLRAMSDVVRGAGAQLLVVVPPVLDRVDGSDGLLRGAADAGVAAIRPVRSGTYGPEFYRDAGFHLNPHGAQVFTAALIPALRGELTLLTRAESPRARVE
jgi:hypothetical protein